MISCGQRKIFFSQVKHFISYLRVVPFWKSSCNCDLDKHFFPEYLNMTYNVITRFVFRICMRMYIDAVIHKAKNLLQSTSVFSFF